MGQLQRNPTPRMQEMLRPAAEARDSAVGRYQRIRDAHFNLNRRGGAGLEGALRRMNRMSTGGGLEAAVDGLTPYLRVQVMLDEWEKAAAAQRKYETAVRRAAVYEYWNEKREVGKAEYDRTIASGACGANQACLGKAARQQWGTRIPANGTWSGVPGNSVWTPEPGTDADDALKDENARRTAAGKTPLGGVRYRNGHPDYGPFSSARVRISDMQGNTSKGPAGDFGKARAAARQRYGPNWNHKTAEVGRTWHHNWDGEKMYLVDQRLHNTVFTDPSSGIRRATGGSVHTGSASMVRDPRF